jgi:tetratricopeptide (TPR) repeat protein
MERPIGLDDLRAQLLGGELSAEQWLRLGQTSPAERETLAEALKSEIDRLVRSAPPAAMPLAERLMRLTEDLPSRRALALRGRAVANHANGRSAAAVPDYREAISRYEAAGEELEAARIRRSLVDALQMSGDAEAALEEGERARTVFVARGEQQLLAQLQCNLGNVHFRLDDYRSSEQCYRDAIDRFDALGNATGAAFARYNLGNVETNANRFGSAEENFRHAEAAFAAAGLQVLAADARYGVAYLTFRRGEYAAAERALLASRDEFLALGKPLGPALCQMDLAELHLRLDAWRDAHEQAEQAAAAFAAAGSRYEWARSSLFAGVALARLGQRARAESVLQAAERELEALGNRTLAALTALHRCELRLQGGAAPDVGPELLPELDRARATLHRSGDRFLAGVGDLALARGRLAGGDAAGARELLEALLRSTVDLPLQALLEIEAHCLLADLELSAGHSAAAAAQLRSAVRAGEAAYARVAPGDARLAFFRERQPVVARLARMTLEHSGSAAAAAVIGDLERSRQRSLAEHSLDRRAEGPAVTAARVRLDALLGRTIEQVEADPGQPRRSAGRASLAGELRATQDLLARGLRQWRPTGTDGLRPGTGSSETEPSPFDSLPPGDLLVYFLLSDGRLWLLFGDPHRPEGLCAEPLEVSAEQLERWLMRWRFQLDKFRLGRDYLARHGRQLALAAQALLGELGTALFSPLARQLDGRPLTLVPYGTLHELPLHAAVLGGRALIEWAPLTLARSLRQLGRCRTPRPLSGVREVWACGAEQDGLPAVGRELRALAEHLGPRLRRVDPDDLFAALGRRTLSLAGLHIAAHGSFQPDHPLFSGLRLDQRSLTTFDLCGVHLECGLVTLSGCETGRLSRSRSDELHGPEQGFLAAGAGAVISSLWPVADEDAASFMAELYGHLARGAAVREAYAATVRARRAAEPHPFAWAGFVLTGDPDSRVT